MENYNRIIDATREKLVRESVQHLRWLYTNAKSMGNKQKEVENVVHNLNSDNWHQKDLG